MDRELRKAGLFRDYRPQLWDTEGADIANDSTRTPESWDQVEGGEPSWHTSIANNAVRSSATPTSQPLAASSVEQQTPSQQRDEEGPQLGTGDGSKDSSGQRVEDIEMEDA